ncbi:reductive dehalogenase [Dehalococcoides mccartyi]|nr:reductive dehalogenase [Dehalococcoides mccartyi]AMU87181.1 reductive dehalogenase [Dehalococcoides mccartyi]
MSNFHSIVSRRDFMKALGLAGVGIGGSAAGAPVFHDLDELIASEGSSYSSSPSAIHNAPWWVKERDYENTTTEIDWSQIIRLDQGKDWQKLYPDRPQYGSFRILLNLPQDPDMIPDPAPILEGYIKNKYPEWKGTQTRDHALQAADSATFDHISFLGVNMFGDLRTRTPEQFGVPKHQGTPEENLKMCRAFLRLVGAHDVGNVPLTENTRKLIYKSGITDTAVVKEYQFTDDEKLSENDTAWKIPNKLNNMLTYSMLNCTELCLGNTLSIPKYLASDGVGNGAIGTLVAYQRSFIANFQLQNFLHSLGYQSVRGASYNICPSTPFGTLAGIGEHARMATVIVSPMYGATMRVCDRCLTDLPLAPTKPIDAGINKFCETCGICAEECPFGSLSKGGSSWDHFLSNEPLGNGNAPGFKGWRLDLHKCNYCGICQSACPFNSVDNSWVHSLIKSTVGTTSIFNGFFANMEKNFNYGFHNPENWWDMEQPVFGIKKEWLGGD